MAESENGQGPQLSVELAAALQRSTDQTLGALHSLRTALREHVYQQRARGATLPEIDGGLKEMIDTAVGNLENPAYASDRLVELKTQVSKWSDQFFFRSPTRL